MNWTIGAPQIILIILWLVQFSVFAFMHNKKIVASLDFPSKIVSSVVVLLLLLWGGFFTA